MTTLLEGALGLARRGLRVFPVAPRGKMPITAHGCKDATTDATTIRAWWQRNPGCNVAVATGAGLTIIDIDSDDGEAAIAELERKNEPLPKTVEVITSRGRHIYLRSPREIRNSAGKLAAGVDVRGEGGFVVAPPSIHETGRIYRWSVDSAAKIAEAPEWLLDLLGRPKPAAAPIAEGSEAGAPSCSWADVIELGIDEGGRDDGLARLVGHYLPHHDPREVLQLALLFNAHRCRPPLPDADVYRICNSIAAAELRKGTAL
jgi:hypothetical protein